MKVRAAIARRDALAELEQMKAKEANKLKKELDEIFRSKISSPEQVTSVYMLLQKYKSYTGKDYKITFEENTIV